MKVEILKMLLNSREYVSGQKMCDRLHVSRTAVWKAMNQLKEEGYEIESVTNKGYRILSCPDLVTKEAVESRVKTQILGKKVHYKEEMDSTNTEAKRIADEEDSHGTLVLTEIQNSGKGRRGRHWISQKETGIWMSLILKPRISPQNSSMLTLIAALAVSGGIRKVTGLEAMIKWPNDIVVNGKKVCGILTEMSSEVDYINYIIVGMGVNVNIEEFPEDIKEIATSLYLEGKKKEPEFHKLNRSQLIEAIMESFEVYYESFLETESMKNLIEEYNSILINIGKTVKVSGAGEEICGIARGINEKGEILIETEGRVWNIMSGEVSVRGLYGYV